MENIKILWVDDEIDLLEMHVMFLEAKGHLVSKANNGPDAIDMVAVNNYDIVFLDENMPGMSGLEVLTKIKEQSTGLPVVMITKSEEENIMDEAIGSQIDDYLIKPVNPNQILLTLKKHLANKQLVSKKTSTDYLKEFNQLAQLIAFAQSFDQWVDVYKKIVYWELKLDQLNDAALEEILINQKNEANREFGRFIRKNYESWFQKDANRPMLSHDFFKDEVFPLIDKHQKVFVIIIDNLRYDQWKILEKEISQVYNIDKEIIYSSILPTATQYARNAIFSGLTPAQIAQMYPQYWLNDDQEGGKNQFEEQLLETQIQRFRRKDTFYFTKIFNKEQGSQLIDKIANVLQNDLGVVVYNFVDMLSHARTETPIVKELAQDESAYRSLTRTWFEHSSLLELLRILARKKIPVVFSTDHGMTHVNSPVKVVGDKKVTTNLRYKQGRNLSYNPKDVFEIHKPENVGLPKTNVSSKYIFAYHADFFAYPNNYNHYVKYYKDTFQHGGISLEEMLIPLIRLMPK